MKKFLFKFFLALSFILLGGHSHAYTHKATVSSSELKAFHQSQSEATRTLKINRDFISSSRPFQTLNERATIDNTDNKEENELEEDHTTDEKEIVTAKNYFIVFVPAQAPQYLNFSIHKCLQDCKHFFYSSSRKKHIAFRVLRI